jgi:4-amino-4-deoxy-L-arabinose transferase-like glycosyltransferase
MSSRKKQIGIIALIILFGFLLRTPYFFHTMQELDEGSHAANAVILMNGGLPYIDAVNNKPPGIFYIYFLIFLLFGKYNIFAVHLVTFFWMLATALVLAVLAYKAGGRAAAILTLLFYVTFTTVFAPNMLSADTEIFMALPYSLTALLLWQALAGKKGYLFFLSGVAAGLTPLIKQVGGVEVAAVAVYLLILPLLSGKERWFASLKATLQFGIGCILPAAATGLLFYRYGILDDAVFWTIKFPVHYVQQGSAQLDFMSQIRVEFFQFALSTIILWILCFFWIKLAVTDCRRPEKPPHGFDVFLILWLISSIAATLVGNRMYSHYFIQILPPLCLIAALRAAPYFVGESSGGGKYWKIAIVTLTVLPGIIFTCMAIPYEVVTTSWGGPKPDFRLATEYIKAHTDPEDKIFVWGWFTPVYVYTKRTPASRFVFTTTQTEYKAGDDPEVEKDRSDKLWVQVPESWPMLMADLERNKPRMIIDTSPGDYHDFGRYPIKDFPMLRDYVEHNCRLEAQIAGMDIYGCPGSDTTAPAHSTKSFN